MNLRRHWLLGVAIAVLLASTSVAFWPVFGDERLLLEWVTTQPWSRVALSTHIKFPHYPPYYLVVKAWGSILPVETVRVVSVAASVGTLLVTYDIGRRRWGRYVGGVAVVLLALSPLFAIQSHWIRPYPIFALLVCLSWWCILRERVRWVAWATVATLVVWWHLFGVVFVGAQLVWLAYQRTWHWPALAAVVANMAASGVLILGRIQGAGGLRSGGRNITHVTTPPGIVDLLVTPGALVMGGFGFSVQAVAIVVVSAMALLGLRRRPALALWVGVPLLSVAVGSMIEPVYQLKYFSAVAPAVVLAISAWLRQYGTAAVVFTLAPVVLVQIVTRLSEVAASNKGAFWIATHLFKPW